MNIVSALGLSNQSGPTRLRWVATTVAFFLGTLVGSGAIWNMARVQVDKKQLQCTRAAQVAALYKEQGEVYHQIVMATEPLARLVEKFRATQATIPGAPPAQTSPYGLALEQASTDYDLLVDRFKAIEKHLAAIEGRPVRDIAVDGRGPAAPSQPHWTGRVLIDGQVVRPFNVLLRRNTVVVLPSCGVSLRLDLVHPDSTADITWIDNEGRKVQLLGWTRGYRFTGRTGPNFFYAIATGIKPEAQEVRTIVYQAPSKSDMATFEFEWSTTYAPRNAGTVVPESVKAWMPLSARELSIPLYLDSMLVGRTKQPIEETSAPQ